MGIFKTTRKVTDEEREFQTENLKQLVNEFDATEAIGEKKYKEAMQFIYDRKRKSFVVVAGPEKTFKLKNPYIVEFDQVKEASVEIKGKNIFMKFTTKHPYAKKIRYKMNYKSVKNEDFSEYLEMADRISKVLSK